jgi:methylenetetrahydrofolate reductase (NADH)
MWSEMGLDQPMALFCRAKSESAADARSALDPIIVDRVGHAHLELIPTPKVHLQFEHLPANSTVSVTCSPARDIQATLDTAAQLLDHGHRVIPHLAARMVESPERAARIVEWLTNHGVRDVFVIGGDAPTPHGPYQDALSLMRALLDANADLDRIGFGGYPDGHANIDAGALAAALADKQQLLAEAEVNGFVSTQMCFDTKTIKRWIGEQRKGGFDLPIHLGIPGLIDSTKLLTMGMKLGIGASLRYLRKNRAMVTALATPGHYDPLGLLVPLAPDMDSLGIAALHIFTFNQVANTVAWQMNIGGSAAFLDNPQLDNVDGARVDNTEVVHRGLSV